MLINPTTTSFVLRLERRRKSASCQNYCETRCSFWVSSSCFFCRIAKMSSNLAPTDSPLRGPTLSTSTSSFEAYDPHDPNLSKLATKMFKTTEEYITNELNIPLEDYKLLENMNKATFAKYSDMQQIADNLATSTAELNAKLLALEPFMNQIDEIETTVSKLEAAVYKLDSYSIALDAKFKSLMQKRS